MIQKPANKIFSGKIAAQALATASLPTLPPGEEIYDIKAPVIPGLPWGEWALQLVLFLLAAGLFVLIYRILTREPVKTRKKIVQSPQKQALRAVARLKLSPVWENRQMKEICENLVLILKNFIKDAQGIGLGAAATSDEMLMSLRENQISSQALKKIRELFSICDLIRYTGKQCEADADELAKIVEELVNHGGWEK
jgi:hypothetical protein